MKVDGLRFGAVPRPRAPNRSRHIGITCSADSRGSRVRDLPRVVLTTVAVVVVPVLVAMTLRASAVISSPWLSMVLAGVLSLVASRIGSTYWRKRRGAGDLLFSDLLIWGWLRRWRQDRRLAKAVRSLGLMRADGAAAPESLSAARAQHL